MNVSSTGLNILEKAFLILLHSVHILGLGSFEITVEHETASGLTTEVESKWTQPLKSEHPETR